MIIFISINAEFNIVLLYNFKVIFYGKHFENTQVKHTTQLNSFQTQCNDNTCVDKLFTNVFKSCRFDKYALKSYLKITVINSMLLLIKWLSKSYMIWLQDDTLKNCLNIGQIGSVLQFMYHNQCMCYPFFQWVRNRQEEHIHQWCRFSV